MNTQLNDEELKKCAIRAQNHKADFESYAEALRFFEKAALDSKGGF